MEIKFVYNGIKDKNTGRLYKAWFCKGNHINGEDIITIYAKDYNSLPEVDGLKIINESDLMTDYFEKDRIEVCPDNKYYNEVLTAWKQQEIHRLKTAIKSHQNSIKRCEQKIELYKDIPEYKAYYEKYKNMYNEYLEEAKQKLNLF